MPIYFIGKMRLGGESLFFRKKMGQGDGENCPVSPRGGGHGGPPHHRMFTPTLPSPIKGREEKPDNLCKIFLGRHTRTSKGRCEGGSALELLVKDLQGAKFAAHGVPVFLGPAQGGAAGHAPTGYGNKGLGVGWRWGAQRGCPLKKRIGGFNWLMLDSSEKL